MVDALALGASSARNGGSSPLPGTNKSNKIEIMYNPGIYWFNMYLAKKADELEKKRYSYFLKNNAFTAETAIELNITDKESLEIKGESRFSPIKITPGNKYYYDKIASKKIQDFKRLLLIIAIFLLVITLLMILVPIILLIFSYLGVLLLLIFNSPN